MATAHWFNEYTHKTTSKVMGVPKKAGKFEHWLKMARKTIKDIPETPPDSYRLTINEIRANWIMQGQLRIDRTTRGAI
jgi:hypothetical protein